jgi:hypothetical protein
VPVAAERARETVAVGRRGNAVIDCAMAASDQPDETRTSPRWQLPAGPEMPYGVDPGNHRIWGRTSNPIRRTVLIPAGPRRSAREGGFWVMQLVTFKAAGQ